MYMLYMILFMITYRFLLLPERLGRLHDSYRSLLKSAENLRKRVEEETMKSAVVLDDEPETYIRDTISSPEAEEYFKNLRPDSFQHIFWQPQVEAASESKPMIIQLWVYIHDLVHGWRSTKWPRKKLCKSRKALERNLSKNSTTLCVCPALFSNNQNLHFLLSVFRKSLT